MGDTDLQRRYARPGELDAPSSVLESNAFKQRLGGQLNSDRKNPGPVSRELRSDESEPVLRSAPPGGETRASAEVNPQPANAVPRSPGLSAGNEIVRRTAPPGGEARASAEVNPQRANAVPRSPGLPASNEIVRRTAPPLAREARVSVDLTERSRNALPAPRDLRPAPPPSPRRSPAPPASQARMGAGMGPYRRSPAPPPNRGAIPRRKTPGRFELLPEPQPLWNRLGWSAAAQVAFVGFLLLIPVMFPQQMETALQFNVVELMQPVTHIEVPANPPPPPKIKPRVQPKPIPPKPKPLEVEPPKLNPKQPHVFLVLKPELKTLRTVEAKPVDLKPIFAQAEIVLTSNQPKRPKEELKAPIFQALRKEDINAPSLGLGTLPATLVAAASKVQTGGFGDPRGVHGPANPNKAANINQAGSPNLPGGPGYGNGTGGAQGARGTLASDGPRSNGPATPAAGTGGSSTGVAILSKPNPSYSTEARTMKLEGDVVLEVVFLASGQLQVIRVVSGLGHGLDEGAIQAARLIRFRPAQRDGQPVDFHARVRIEFRLAN